MSESVFDAWAKQAAAVIDAESKLAAAQFSHRGELGDSREKVVQDLLSRVLPSIYEVGAGQIVDSDGRYSRQMDIVIARRDFPVFVGKSGSKTYPIESVLATCEVKTYLDRERIKEAMDNIASISELSINVVQGSRAKVAHDLGIPQVATDRFVHTNPILTGRFDAMFWPPSYVIGLGGVSRMESLVSAVNEWAKEQVSRPPPTVFGMQKIPAVISCGELFGWRNSDPWTAPDPVMLLLGRDECPLRLVILHLLYTLTRKIPVIPDRYGITPNLDAYLSKCKPPKL